MFRHLRLLVILPLLLSGLTAGGARADDDAHRKIQYVRGIRQSYGVTCEERGDLDGDGMEETLICYRDPDRAIGQQGGVLVLNASKVAWHALFDGVYPTGAAVDGQSVTFSLVEISASGEKKFKKTMRYGKDLVYRSDVNSPFYEVKAVASSTLKGRDLDPAMVFDRDLKTAWAEGAEGTGVDETVTLTFSRPVHIGLVGVLHGNFAGRRAWRDNNRLHRAEVTVETASDRFDPDAEVDFADDLGLGMYGDTVELSFTNKPIMRYFKVGKKNVSSLELKITSVLLGEKNDDAYVSEIDVAQLIPKAVLLGKVKAKAPKTKTEKKKAEEPDDDWVDEDDF